MTLPFVEISGLDSADSVVEADGISSLAHILLLRQEDPRETHRDELFSVRGKRRHWQMMQSDSRCRVRDSLFWATTRRPAQGRCVRLRAPCRKPPRAVCLVSG